ncbi:MAG TPA: class I SAM-dependent RNA methyltransferase [Myxococcales bacterium]
MPVTLHIDGLSSGSDGVARLDGRVVFVAGGVPGDVVEAELVEEKERSARARIVRVVTPSPDRVEPGCAHASDCGGCSWLHVSAQGQAKAKQAILRDALGRIGGVELGEASLNPLIRSPLALRYRRRATLHLSGGRIGYRAASSHVLVEIEGCPQLAPRLEQAIPRLREALKAEGAPPKCTDIALACDERRITAAFEVAAAGKSTLEKVRRLMARARLDGAVLAVEGQRGQPLGDALLSWPAPLAEGVTAYGRADLFAQANPEANLLLVGEALRMLGEGGESLLELYSGAGNFSFAAARRFKAATCIESSPDAVELARRSAREAKVENVRFIQGDALACAESLAKEGRRFETLLLDPPRAGAKGIGKVAERSGVRRVVYVSCDPATLSRDVKELQESGYRLIEATPVDMFPQTFHLETVARLDRG